LFLSTANNLVPGQRSGSVPTEAATEDLFLHDHVTGATTLVSHAAASPTTTSALGVESAVLSADGRWAAFVSLSSGLVAGQATVALVSHAGSVTTTGNGDSGDLSISADGRWIAFGSQATDLDPAGSGVFLYDAVSGALRRIGPGTKPTLSADGGTVVFFSDDP